MSHPPDHDATGKLFSQLVATMATLRGASGCPWDKKQTHESLKACLLEETYEVLAAITSKDARELQEELGDLLLQVLFHAQIAAETGQFSVDAVLKQLLAKLIRRHPHVFSSSEDIHSSETAIQNWEQIKAKEKPRGQGLLSGLPTELPALLRAWRMGAKVSRVGFDWETKAGVWKKVKEEIQEFESATEKSNVSSMEEEFGDLLFSLTQAARFFAINPEEALRRSADKFQKRWEWMETRLEHDWDRVRGLTPEAWEALWKEAKSFTETV